MASTKPEEDGRVPIQVRIIPDLEAPSVPVFANHIRVTSMNEFTIVTFFAGLLPGPARPGEPQDELELPARPVTQVVVPTALWENLLDTIGHHTATGTPDGTRATAEEE